MKNIHRNNTQVIVRSEKLSLPTERAENQVSAHMRNSYMLLNRGFSQAKTSSFLIFLAFQKISKKNWLFYAFAVFNFFVKIFEILVIPRC